MLVPAKPDNVVKSAENKTTPQIAPDSAVKVTRNRQPVASVNDQVLSGYQAYMAGDDAAAARYYRQAAQAEPRNVDAFLGLAAVAARQGKADEAATHYSRVLELEPRNISAQTGLIGLMGQLDPVASESRIKSLLAQQPEAAFLHAALGNLYADQGQWPSAQQAYFQAYHFDPANAEYAFNLAVSLDQMGKPDLALTHYQRALELQAKHGGALDKAQLEARITQLRQSSNK
jgi:tetratricopeptide (TPR) repeat protein